MLATDLAQETYFSLLANKSRSILTVLGIVIGIGSVIAMTAIGQGAAADIETNIQSLGTNMLVVSPSSVQGPGSIVKGAGGTATTLDMGDSEIIESQIQNIDGVAPTVSSREQITTTTGTNTNTHVYGVTESYQTVKSVDIQLGNFITDSYNDKYSKVAVLGPTARDTLFGEDVDPIGQKIRIKNLEYTVIGVTVSKGGSMMGSSDDLVFIPITTAQRYITGSDSLNSINVQVTEEDLMSSVEEEINSLLLTEHKISDPDDADFTIVNQAEIMDAMSEVTGTLTLLLGAIAGISLLVGGIGIMNMMLTTVTERTREIGLRKSLGAKSLDVTMQFLAESVALTFIGGIIGIVLGAGAASLITKLSGTTTVITIFSVVLAFGVSAAIGIVFGYYPARRASKLNPIDALRYE